ncbi:hypothetical protein C8J57DRAFT_1714498 [Mycena rebaudengoi]|nr:hypothetical protein C8J57DRAFT_1714498 [Mycena rebaudengoi]
MPFAAVPLPWHCPPSFPSLPPPSGLASPLECPHQPASMKPRPPHANAFEICVAVGSSTDTKLMKLALYAVDETALLLNRSPVGPVPPEFLALLEAYERILDDIRRHIESAQISTNKRGNLISRHMSSSRLKNELKNQLKTMLHGGQLALPTLRENTVEILSISLRASAAICEAPPLNFLKPIVGIAALIFETAKTAKSNRDAAEELAKHAINVTNCVVERAWNNGTVSETNEDALNILKRILEDVHSYPIFLNKRRRAMSWIQGAEFIHATCVLSSNECLRSSNELVRSNTIQLDALASTVKQLDGEMSQNFAALHLQLSRSAGSEKAAWAVAPLGSTNTSKRFLVLLHYECVPTLKPPDGVALAEAYTRLESESDGADGKVALERFVEAWTALVRVAEAERLAEDCTWTTDACVAKRLIAASHAPADITEGSYSIMDSPYLPPHLEAYVFPLVFLSRRRSSLFPLTFVPLSTPAAHSLPHRPPALSLFPTYRSPSYALLFASASLPPSSHPRRAYPRALFVAAAYS